jgi:hypothetical protein
MHTGLSPKVCSKGYSIHSPEWRQILQSRNTQWLAISLPLLMPLHIVVPWTPMRLSHAVLLDLSSTIQWPSPAFPPVPNPWLTIQASKLPSQTRTRRQSRTTMTVWASWAATITVLLASVLLYPIVVKIHRRNKETRPDGLQVISNPENPTFKWDGPHTSCVKAPANRFPCRIVAVHSLGAYPDYTWTCQDSAKSARTVGVQRVHLLKDLLKFDFPDARILSFTYNSDWLIDALVKTAQQIGHKLLDQLAKHRSNYLVRRMGSKVMEVS